MGRMLAIFAALFLSAAGYAGDDLVSQPKVPLPEDGFISSRQYTSAFFGFALSIPGGCRFQVIDQSESDKPLEHFLFAEKCAEKGLTTFGVSATPVVGSADEEVRKAVLLPRIGARVAPEPLRVHGRFFWKNALEEKTLWGQKVWRARYATLAEGFVLLFWMSSYDSRLAADLRRAIETIQFFEPSQARDVAGPLSHVYLPEAARPRIQSTADVNIAQLDGGGLRGNVYVNTQLGFSYRFPDDWVRSTQASLQTSAPHSDSEAISASGSTALPGRCLRVLASFTRFDEHTNGLDFNPRTTLVAGDPTCFIPDMTFPKSLDDQETVQRYGEGLARSLVGTPLIGTQNIKLFGIDLDGHIFVEITSSNAESVTGSKLLRKIRSDMILTAFRNIWIIWLSESDTESEFATVFKSSISFEPSPKLGK